MRHALTSKSEWILYFTAFLTGAAVMVIEILGTRVLAPFYGTSLVVWAALISVTLIALAAGYFLGGWLAARAARWGLSRVIGLAALATALVPVLAWPVMQATDPLGLQGGALASAMVLFFPVLCLLAMTGPWVVHLRGLQGTSAGLTTGVVYAVSTLGSVVGTLGLSFYLLPAFGSRLILAGLSAILLGLAAVLSRWEARRFACPWQPLWLVPLLGLVAAAWLANRGEPGRGTVFERESLYGKIAVVDRGNARFLLADLSVIGAVDLTSGASLMLYQQLVRASLSVTLKAKRALLIGLGAGTLVQDLLARGLAVDVIEIDPAVAEAAQRYFGFRPPGALWIADARTKVRQIPQRYDLIIHDCFTGGSEPVHLLTREALADLRAALHPEGVLVLNFVGLTKGAGRKALDAVWRTLASVFPYLVGLAVEPALDLTDWVFLASPQPLSLPAPLASYQVHAAPEGPILSDDYNPLENLQIAKAKAYRAQLLAQVGSALFR